jgi:hypothetical protein
VNAAKEPEIEDFAMYAKINWVQIYQGQAQE